jgi:hypothetical protein
MGRTDNIDDQGLCCDLSGNSEGNNCINYSDEDDFQIKAILFKALSGPKGLKYYFSFKRRTMRL